MIASTISSPLTIRYNIMATKSISQRALRLLNQSPSTNRFKQYPSTTFRFMSGSSDVVDSSSHHHKSRLPCDFISTLQKRYPNLAISTNTYDLDSHGHGESHHPVQPPDAVIRPTNVEEVQDILSLCCRERKYKDNDDNLSTVELVSVIPYGAGTSVEGHLNFLFPTDNDTINDRDTNEEGKIVEIPSTCFANNDDTTKSIKKVRVQRKGGISIDMCNFNSIGEVGSDGFVQVGAGVTRNTLNEALRYVYDGGIYVYNSISDISYLFL